MLTPAFLAVLATSAGCTCRKSESLYINGVLLSGDPPECTVDTMADSFLAGGVWDVAVGDIYTLNLNIVNALVPRGDLDALIAEPNLINMQGFDISVEAPVGINGFDRTGLFLNVAGVIPPQGTLALAGLPLFGPDVAADARADFGAGGTGTYTVLVHLSPRGVTLGGNRILGAEFTFPILVCFGCLVFGCDASGSCATPAMPVDAPCGIGQDEAVHCSSVGLTTCP
jgi:hypothetical protein